MCFEDSADDEPQSAQCVSKILQTMSHKVRNAFRRCIGCIQCCHEDSQSHLLSIYLENRKQSCRIGGTSSDMKEIICGIPQGSCLGPLIFLIYINDLPLSLQKSHFSMYADDTAILLSSESIDDLPNDLNLDLLKLQDWLDANKLSLNFVKTQSLIIGSGPNLRRIEGQTDAQPSFSIGDQAIEMITDTKYLGLQIDSQLKWENTSTL